MIKVVGDIADLGKCLWLGLTEENIRRLQKNDPILIDFKELGVDANDLQGVMIFAGTTEEEMMDPFMKAGLIGPDTKLTIDPDTIPDIPPEDVVDTIILRVPPQIRDMLTSDKVHDVGPEIQTQLRNLAMRQVAEQNMPGVRKIEMQQITWRLTNNAADVTAMAPPHDCPTCRTAMMRASIELAENPDLMLAIGRIEYRKHFGSV